MQKYFMISYYYYHVLSCLVSPLHFPNKISQMCCIYVYQSMYLFIGIGSTGMHLLGFNLVLIWSPFFFFVLNEYLKLSFHFLFHDIYYVVQVLFISYGRHLSHYSFSRISLGVSACGIYSSKGKR